MTRQKMIGLFLVAPALVVATTAASCTANGTGTGTFTPAPTTTQSPVGGGSGGTTTPAPTSSTTTPAPTTSTTAPPVVGVPQPGDEDFVELDCADFPIEQEDGSLLDAQDVFNGNRLDIHGLDADGDGTACEDTDPAASANDTEADSVDETDADAADVAVAPEGEQAGLTIDVRSY